MEGVSMECPSPRDADDGQPGHRLGCALLWVGESKSGFCREGGMNGDRDGFQLP